MTPAPLTLARIRELRAHYDEVIYQLAEDGYSTVEEEEILAALAAAEALARLEEWLRATDRRCVSEICEDLGLIHLTMRDWDTGRGKFTIKDKPTLLAALIAALDRVEAKA